MKTVAVVPRIHAEPRNAVLRHDDALGRVLAYARASGAQRTKDRADGLREILLVETVKADGATRRQPRTADHARRSPLVGNDIASVMDCIKAHESGNYSESSHPGSGSGAYQYVPGTWRTWSARAGYPGYDYAYQAPAAVQDAVTVFTLTNGGAGNWSPKYGADSCTVGHQ